MSDPMWIVYGLAALFGFVILMVAAERLRHLHADRRTFARAWQASAEALGLTPDPPSAADVWRLRLRMEGAHNGAQVSVTTEPFQTDQEALGKAFGFDTWDLDRAERPQAHRVMIRAHCQAPLSLGLQLKPEHFALASSVAGLFGLGGDGDLKTGDAAFDAAFIASATDRDGALRLLGPQERAALTDAFQNGVIAVYDFGVMARLITRDPLSEATLRPLIDRAVDLAQRLDRAKARAVSAQTHTATAAADQDTQVEQQQAPAQVSHAHR